MKNTINLISIIYQNDNFEIQLAICQVVEDTIKSLGATAQLQDYSFDDMNEEASLTFTLSRRLTKQEREELICSWEDEYTQVQFHAVKKLF